MYNVFIQYRDGEFHLWGISEEKLSIIIDAYHQGKDSFTLSGKKYFIIDLWEMKIFTLEKEITESQFARFCRDNGLLEKSFLGRYYFPKRALQEIGKDVTDDILGNAEYGAEMTKKKAVAKKGEQFISDTRMTELRQIKNEHFDLLKLIRLCDELNLNYSKGNYLSVGMIGRTIINHVPPIFGQKTFGEVANHVSGSSLKKSFLQLNTDLKNIADRLLHLPIRKSESLPSEAQIDFKQNFDVLLEEIIRILK